MGKHSQIKKALTIISSCMSLIMFISCSGGSPVSGEQGGHIIKTFKTMHSLISGRSVTNEVATYDIAMEWINKKYDVLFENYSKFGDSILTNDYGTVFTNVEACVKYVKGYGNFLAFTLIRENGTVSEEIRNDCANKLVGRFMYVPERKYLYATRDEDSVDFSFTLNRGEKYASPGPEVFISVPLNSGGVDILKINKKDIIKLYFKIIGMELRHGQILFSGALYSVEQAD